jgi:hypothetical protein
MVKIPVAMLSLVLVSTQFLLVYAESVSSVEASGTVSSFNGSVNSGLWAAKADINNSTGDLISIFTNDSGDIFVVTLRGSSIILDDQGLAISGTGFVAKNSLLLKEGNGTARINQNNVEITVNGDVMISGHTMLFETK